MGLMNRSSRLPDTEDLRDAETGRARQEVRRLRQGIADALERSGPAGMLAGELKKLIGADSAQILRPDPRHGERRSATQHCQHSNWSLHHVGCGNEHRLICDDCGSCFDD